MCSELGNKEIYKYVGWGKIDPGHPTDEQMLTPPHEAGHSRISKSFEFDALNEKNDRS